MDPVRPHELSHAEPPADSAFARRPADLLRLWWRALRVMRPFIGRLVPLWVATPLLAALGQVPFLFLAALTDHISQGQRPGAGPLRLDDTVPVVLPTLGHTFHLRMPLWAAVAACGALATVVAPGLTYLLDYASQRATLSIRRALQVRVLDRLLRDAADGVPHPSADVAVALQSYGDVLASVFTVRAREWLTLAALTVQSLAVLVHTDRRLGMAVAAWGLLFSFVVPNLSLARRGRPRDAEAGARGLTATQGHLSAAMEAHGRAWHAYLLELTAGMDTIVSLRLAGTFARRLEGLVRERDALALRTVMLAFLGGVAAQLAGTGGLAALLIGIVRQYSVGQLLNVFNFSNAFLAQLRRGGGTFAMEVSASVPLRRALALLEADEERSAGVLAAPPAVRLAGVSVEALEAGTPRRILRALDLEVPAGAIVALVGATGSGKSALLRLLAGREVLATGEARVGAHRFTAGQRIGLLPSVTVIDQFSTLFRGTTRANILLGVGPGEAAMSLDEAVERACLPRDPESLASILDRQLDPTTGSDFKLAGGERKRVILARAMVRTLQPLLLVDEVDSGLDQATAAVVLRNVVGWARARGATTFIATHRPEALPREVDLTLMMAEGRCLGLERPTRTEAA